MHHYFEQLRWRLLGNSIVQLYLKRNLQSVTIWTILKNLSDIIQYIGSNYLAAKCNQRRDNMHRKVCYDNFTSCLWNVVRNRSCNNNQKLLASKCGRFSNTFFYTYMRSPFMLWLSFIGTRPFISIPTKALSIPCMKKGNFCSGAPVHIWIWGHVLTIFWKMIFFSGFQEKKFFTKSSYWPTPSKLIWS